MKKKKTNSVKAANQLPSIEQQLNDINNNLSNLEQKYLSAIWWIKELDMLSTRYSYLCVKPDLNNMSLHELWGVYKWLSNQVDTHGA